MPPSWLHPNVGFLSGVIVPVFIEFTGIEQLLDCFCDGIYKIRSVTSARRSHPRFLRQQLLDEAECDQDLSRPRSKLSAEAKLREITLTEVWINLDTMRKPNSIIVLLYISEIVANLDEDTITVPAESRQFSMSLQVAWHSELSVGSRPIKIEIA